MALVVALVVALAAIAGVALFYRDHGHVIPEATAPELQAGSAPPALPRTLLLDKDRQFLFMLATQGIQPSGSRNATIKDAHRVCSRVARGETEQQIVQDIVTGSPAMTAKTATNFADAAIEVYCPQG